MKHKEIKNLLGAYVDGELQDLIKKEVEEHLKICPECIEEIEFLRALHYRIKKEKIPFPSDSYWDNFPKRVMKRLHEKRTIGFFSAKVPRIKWELAGGVILLLLTFIVSKQILTKKTIEEIDIPIRPKVSEKFKTDEGRFAAKDGDELGTYPVTAGKAAGVVSKKGKVEKEPDDRSVLSEPEEKTEIFKKEAPIPGISKSSVEIKKDEKEEIGGVITENGISEEKQDDGNRVGFVQGAVPSIENEKVEIDILSEIKEKEEFLRISRDRVKSLEVRRGLIRLLYYNADKTRKIDDIERANVEIETYRDSFPDEFKDTLKLYSDSLLLMIEEVKRKEQVKEETEENSK